MKLPSIPSGMRAILLPLLISALFSGSFIGGKYTTLDLQPLTTSLLRYIIAWLFLSGLVLRHWFVSQHRSPQDAIASSFFDLRLRGKDAPLMMLLGLFGIVGYHYFFFSSLRYTAVANTAIINAFNPVLTGILAAILIGERLSPRNYLGGAIALVGVLLLLSRGDLTTLLHLQINLGDFFMLISVVCWVIYALLIKVLGKRYSGFTITYYAALFGVLLLFPLASLENPLEQIRSISAASAIAVLYMGIGASGLGYLMYNLSIQVIGPTKTSSSVYSLVPIYVALLALVFFHQPITPVMIASMGIITVGLQSMLKR